MKNWLMALGLGLISVAGGAQAAPSSRSRDISQCKSWIRSRPLYPKEQPGELKVVSPDTACFEGEIWEDNVDPLLTWLKRLPRGANPLLIARSRGGEATAGIEVMDELQATNAEVHVVDLCGSSCADYFFAGAKKRSVDDGSIILFHGGYSPAGRKRIASSMADDRKPVDKSVAEWAKIRDDSLAQFDRDFALQTKLYAAIGVNDAITRNFDMLDASKLPESDCDPTRKVDRNAVFFTVAQLRAMGVRIEEGTPETDPGKVNAKLRQMGAPFEVCLAPTSFFGETLPVR
jgi:hypothetical protein